MWCVRCAHPAYAAMTCSYDVCVCQVSLHVAVSADYGAVTAVSTPRHAPDGMMWLQPSAYLLMEGCLQTLDLCCSDLSGLWLLVSVASGHGPDKTLWDTRGALTLGTHYSAALTAAVTQLCSDRADNVPWDGGKCGKLLLRPARSHWVADCTKLAATVGKPLGCHAGPGTGWQPKHWLGVQTHWAKRFRC